ncbi:MAG: SEC-C metal-binding domain-containing protein [Polyangiaceae bacterium]
MMHFVATIGRNDPCPCSSGKKYKKCCLPLYQARADEQRRAAAPPTFQDVARAMAPLLAFDDDDDGLDALSNSAVDLANAGRFDEALAACAQLRADFPDVVDGLERSAMVHAKLGHHALAADFYRQAFDFVNHPDRREDYEDRDYYREQAEKHQRLAHSV